MNGLRALLVTGLATLMLPLAANAVTIVIGDTSGNNLTDVEGTMVFSVSQAPAGTYKFAFSIENTSNLGTTRLTGVAFDLLTGAVLTANTKPAGWGFEADGTLPGEASAFDACFYSGANCGAGGNDGLLETDAALGGFSVSFTLAGGLTAQQVEDLFKSGFDDRSLKVCVRVISIPKTGAGSGNGAGSDVACYKNGGGDEVPEPGTLALLGLGLMGLGLSRRRVQA